MIKRLHIICFFMFFYGFSQEDSLSKREISKYKTYQGNQKLDSDNFNDAEYYYKKAISKDSKNSTAKYNLGTAYYKKGKHNIAAFKLLQAAKAADKEEQRHKAYHNLGNALMEKKDYQNAVKAYQNALINNPNDDETRYNFALAKELLKNNPPPPKDKKDKDKDKKDKDKDKKDKDKDKKDKDKKDKNKKDDGKDKKNSNNKPKKEKGRMSAQQARNILNAIENQDQQVQKKINAKKVKRIRIKTEKDW